MAKGNFGQMMDVNSNSAPRQKNAPKKLRSLSIEHAKNGGHIVEHRFENNGPGYHDPEQHVFGKAEGKKMLAHVGKHMGVTGSEDGDREKGESAGHKSAGIPAL